MGLISALLGKSRKSIKTVHRTDEEILEEVFDLLETLRNLVRDLNKVLVGTSVIQKDARLSEMENKLLLLKTKIDAIEDDISWIVDKEMEKKDYFTVQDEAYLEDKHGRLVSVSANLEELAELVNARPSFSELKFDLMNRIYALMNAIIDDVNAISVDDDKLEKIYNNIPNL